MALRVAIIGAGALGRLFAARLQYGGAAVTLVTRPGSVVPASFRLEHQRFWSTESEQVSIPVATELPDADLYVITVRGDQLLSEEGRSLCERLNRKQRPVVVISPALPAGIKQLQQQLPQAHLTLPAVAADWSSEQGLLRYWIAPLSTTRIEAATAASDCLERFTAHLERGGIPAKLAASVGSLSAATTIAFFPLQLALAAVPNLKAWPKDKALTRTVGQAQRESTALAHTVGKVEPGVQWLTRLLSRQWCLRLACWLLPRLQPRLCAFLEQHFGHKLHAQHHLFMTEIEAVAADHGLSDSALKALAARSPMAASVHTGQTSQTSLR